MYTYTCIHPIQMTIIMITLTNKTSLDTMKINYDNQGQTKSTDSPSNLSTREN